jgi:hypothetical protein
MCVCGEQHQFSGRLTVLYQLRMMGPGLLVLDSSMVAIQEKTVHMAVRRIQCWLSMPLIPSVLHGSQHLPSPANHHFCLTICSTSTPPSSILHPPILLLCLPPPFSILLMHLLPRLPPPLSLLLLHFLDSLLHYPSSSFNSTTPSSILPPPSPSDSILPFSSKLP